MMRFGTNGKKEPVNTTKDKSESFKLNKDSDIETQKRSYDIIYQDALFCTRVRGCSQCPLGRYNHPYHQSKRDDITYGCGGVSTPEMVNRRRYLLELFIKEYNQIKEISEIKFNIDGQNIEFLVSVMKLLRNDDYVCKRDVCYEKGYRCPLQNIGCGNSSKEPDMADYRAKRVKLVDAFIEKYDKKEESTIEKLSEKDWNVIFKSIPFHIIMENIKETNSKLESFFKPYENSYMKENAELKDKIKELTTQLKNANSEAVELKEKLKIINETSTLNANYSLNDAYVLKLEAIGFKEFEDLELYYDDENGSRCRIGQINSEGKCFFVMDYVEQTNWRLLIEHKDIIRFSMKFVKWKGSNYIISKGRKNDIYIMNNDIGHDGGLIYNILQNDFVSFCKDENIIGNKFAAPVRF